MYLQARELYKLNHTRLIADVEAEPSPISTAGDTADILNLTNSQLRAVSPIHIQYLKNMGVASSFSISLIFKDELWGLIACHSYTPRFIDFRARESARLIGQIVSSSLEYRQEEENLLSKEKYKSHLLALTKYMVKTVSLEDALIRERITILDMTEATGVALIFENEIYTLGATPAHGQIYQLLDWIKEHVTEELYQTNSISKEFPQASEYKTIASGALAVGITKDYTDAIIWFKPEQIETLNWAGNPNKPFNTDEQGNIQISPRHSFEVW